MIRCGPPPIPRPAVRALLAAALLGLAALAPARGETGRPYLKQPAATPEALARQVAGDRQLLARYAKHFNVPPATVTKALRGAREVTLPPGSYTVWLTGRDGLRYPTAQERTASTRAFLVLVPFDREPHSWLEAGTGNPMRLFRPVEEVEVVVEAPPGLSEEVSVPREVLVPVAAATAASSETASASAPSPTPAT